MGMISTRVLLASAAVVLLLAGCSPTVAAPTPAPSETSEPTVSATPVVPVATSVLLSLDGLAVLDDTGATMESARFDEADTVLALITALTGSQPAVDETLFEHKGIRGYSWQDVRCSTRGQVAFCRWQAATLGGLPLATAQGIRVGSSRADVAALNPVDVSYDEDGDGVSDSFGLEPREVPGTQSLTFPGQVGTGFIGVRLQGDVVVSLRSPAGDFYDV